MSQMSYQTTDSRGFSLHCLDCKNELLRGGECDICEQAVDTQKIGVMHIIRSFFEREFKQMCAGIETTLKNKNYHLCALALSTYTEVFGGLVTGELKIEQGKSKSNFEAFLPFLGKKYVELNEELMKNGTSIYKEVRSKLVHEFFSTPIIWNLDYRKTK